ncbi:MAG: type II toxin-antitoxin system YafQ family toxin [Gammaproteobacteria bacterium]|nr:type II toxin-antitoxin system YafQ family toxin [Gammaproteobacteria bacterium]
MLRPVRSRQFKRDVRLAERRQLPQDKLRALIKSLALKERLDPAYLDHPLRGRWRGYREAHIAPDWLLIYQVVDDELRLARTGRHSDLFRE